MVLWNPSPKAFVISVKLYMVLWKSSKSQAILPSAHRGRLECKLTADLGGHASWGQSYTGLWWDAVIPLGIRSCQEEGLCWWVLKCFAHREGHWTLGLFSYPQTMTRMYFCEVAHNTSPYWPIREENWFYELQSFREHSFCHWTEPEFEDETQCPETAQLSHLLSVGPWGCYFNSLCLFCHCS